MQRILIAEVKQETATFNPALTLYDDFRIYRCADIVEKYRGTSTELSGAFDIFDKRGGIDIVPTVAADSVSGGYIEAAGLDRLLGEMTEAVRANAKVDGAYICLHGAMAGENEPDPEGRLLTAIREALGDIPIVASLDLHAVLTERMIESADVLVPYHTYPHVDHYETGQRAARCLLKLLDGQAKPAAVRVPLPMLVRGDELITATGRFGEAIRMCQALEADERCLAAGVLIGNAFTDVQALQSNVLVTSTQANGWAADEALKIARFMWKSRELFQAELTSLHDSIRIAKATDGLTVFSDAADATASGASGDSNAILRGLWEAEFKGTALIPIVDAPAVAAAFDAGVGERVAVRLGGTRDPNRFSPLRMGVTVTSLHEGSFRYENGTAGNAGRVAVLQADTLTIMATERSVYFVGRNVFEAHGLDPRDFDVVVVKSPNGFRTWYEEIASAIVPVDVPGSTSANLKSLPFENCVRPIFPLDEDVEPGFDLEE